MANKWCGWMALALLTGCATPKPAQQPSAESQLIPNGKVWATLFQQRAAEYKALCLQAYNLAQLRLAEALQQPGSKPLAVVTDLDETALDNSPYDAKRALAGGDYTTETWHDWTSRGEADTLAGSVTFFKYAAAHNVEVFYLTNRDETEREGTLKNLQRYHFPYADNAHLILKQPGGPSSKEERRQQILQSHNIVLLLGDNLADFSALFDKKPLQERENNVLQNAEAFGRKFIVLPNAVYGDWESALFQYSHQLSTARKDSIIKAGLRTY